MSNYPDLDKKYGERKVEQARKRIKRRTGREPVYIELLMELENG